jgi:hypothetical protein
VINSSISTIYDTPMYQRRLICVCSDDGFQGTTTPQFIGCRAQRYAKLFSVWICLMTRPFLSGKSRFALSEGLYKIYATLRMLPCRVDLSYANALGTSHAYSGWCMCYVQDKPCNLNLFYIRGFSVLLLIQCVKSIDKKKQFH